jgi:intraflagellar transport protein 74
LLEISAKQANAKALKSRQETLQRDVQGDLARLKVWNLQGLHQQLQTKLRELSEQEKGLEGLTTKEAILEDIKRNNMEIANMERSVTDLEKTSQQIRDEMRHADSHESGERAAKFEELLKKDSEMSAFLDSFPSAIEEEQKQITKSHALIANTLTAILSSGSAAIVSPDEYRSMMSDLKEKEKEKDSAESTVVGMQREQERLLSDLERVNQLEGKINEELESIRVQLENIKTQRVQFSNVEVIRSNLNDKVQQILRAIKQLEEQSNWTKYAVTTQSTRLDAKQHQIRDNETHRTLSQLESKLRIVEGSSMSLKEDIEDISCTGDYSNIKSEIFSKLNACLLDASRVAMLTP